MKEGPKGARIPVFNEAICIGCGACENACPVEPVRAIVSKPVPIQVTADEPREYFRKQREEQGLDNSPKSDSWLI
jgi:formate hydrogenlyase subunit 6/NADH:ubiquinone oxidoreductase subunit I